MLLINRIDRVGITARVPDKWPDWLDIVASDGRISPPRLERSAGKLRHGVARPVFGEGRVRFRTGRGAKNAVVVGHFAVNRIRIWSRRWAGNFGRWTQPVRRGVVGPLIHWLASGARIMFFDGWFDLLRILIVGVSAYAGLIVMLRLSGKRTLSKMNAFDLIVTVSFGSTLATVLLGADVTLSEGLLAFALLCAMQYAVATLSVRSPRFQAFVKAQPTLLFFRGSFQTATMARERFTEEEVLAAVRASGHADLAGVGAVVLETDGSLSVLTEPRPVGEGAMRNVHPPGDGTGG